MSIHRYAAKSDSSRTAIVEGLRAHGVVVWDIRRPGDLLCWHSRFGPGIFRVLELKTAYGKKNPKPRLDKRQETQTDFLALTSTPVVTDLDQALAALGLTTSQPCSFKPTLAATASVAAR